MNNIYIYMNKNSFMIIIILLIILIIIFIIIGIVLIINNNKNTNINIDQNIGEKEILIPNVPYNNLSYYNIGDILTNPYVPPLEDNRYLVPINVATNKNYVNTNYRQVGILHTNNKDNKDILILMGKPLFVNNNKWNYYAISNQHNNVKLPIIHHNRNALNTNGINELYTGEHVIVEGYNDKYKVTIYENEVIKYLPFI